MENKSDLKSMYFVLFILLLIETVLFILLGNIMAVATFIIALILRSKLPKGTRTPSGIKLAIISTVLHFLSNFFSVFILILAELPEYSDGLLIFSGICSLIFIIYLIATFVLLIISCVQIYSEYKAIDNY